MEPPERSAADQQEHQHGQRADGGDLPGVAEHGGEGEAVGAQADVDQLARDLGLQAQAPRGEGDGEEDEGEQGDGAADLGQAERQVGGHATSSTTKSL
jgi:hypothetical protein